MIRLCQPYGEIAYSYDSMIIINISLSVSCDFLFSFFFLQNTAGNQKTQVMAQCIFFPKVLHLLDYENDSTVSDNDDDDDHLSIDDDNNCDDDDH